MDVVIAELAASQHGLITRAQALELGMTDRQIAGRRGKGLWVALRPGVYRLAVVAETWHQQVLAACLATNAVASHRSAAAVWKLDGFPESGVEVTAHIDGRHGSQGIVVHRTRSLAAVDVATRDAVPVTTATRTLIDLASVLDNDKLEEAVDSALRQRLTSPQYLLRRLNALGGHGRGGVGTLRRLATRRLHERPSESTPQLRLARLLVRRGLPPPVLEYELVTDGRVLARFDLAYPTACVAIEYQSYRHHFGRRAWRRDEVRRRSATAREWLVFEATEDDVEDGAVALAADVAPLLCRSVHR